MADMHSFMLQECKQTKFAGDMAEQIQVSQSKPSDKKKDPKNQVVTIPNRPHSKAIMMENIRYRLTDSGISDSHAGVLYLLPVFNVLIK